MVSAHHNDAPSAPRKKTNYELITLGDELLLGLTPNGHLTFIGAQLGRRGALLRSCPPKPACGRLLLLVLRCAARPTAPILRLPIDLVLARRWAVERAGRRGHRAPGGAKY